VRTYQDFRHVAHSGLWPRPQRHKPHSEPEPEPRSDLLGGRAGSLLPAACGYDGAHGVTRPACHVCGRTTEVFELAGRGIGRTLRLDFNTQRWLQFLFLLLTASALAHVPERKLIPRLNDLSGNLVQAKNTLNNFAYDNENRLTVFTTYSSVGVLSTKSQFQYDRFSRLRARKEYTWVPDNNNSSSPQRGGAGTLAPPPGGGGTWQLNSETRYVLSHEIVSQLIAFLATYREALSRYAPALARESWNQELFRQASRLMNR